MEKTMQSKVIELQADLERTKGTIGLNSYRIEKLETQAIKTSERVEKVEAEQLKYTIEMTKTMDRLTFLVASTKWITAALLLLAGLWDKLPEGLRSRLFGS